MAALVKAPVLLDFKPVDRKRGARHHVPGRLVAAFDVEQTGEEKVFEKRPGISQLELAPNSGVLASGQGLAEVGGSAVVRTDDTVFLQEGATARNLGKLSRAYVSDRFAAPSSYRPSHAIANGKIWYFYGNDSGRYAYRVVDEATGSEIVPGAWVDASTEMNSIRAKAIVAGGFVWLLFDRTSPRRYFYAARFDPANPTAPPVITQAWDLGPHTSLEIHDWDVCAVGGTFYLALIGNWLNNANTQIGAAVFNPATGAVAAAPAPSYTFDGGTTLRHPHILRGHNGADGRVWLAIGASTNGNIYAGWFTTAALAWSYDNGGTFIHQLGGTNGGNSQGIVGYTPDNGTTRVMLVTKGDATAEDEVETRRIVRTNTVTTTTSGWAFGAWVCSEAFQVGSQWHAILQHDDGSTVRLQRGYYLATLDTTSPVCAYVARGLYQRAGRRYQLGTTDFTAASAARMGFAARVTVQGQRIFTALQANPDEAPYYPLHAVIWDLRASLGAPASMMDSSVLSMPGAWPAVIAGGALAELPTMYPRYCSLSSSGSTPGLGPGVRRVVTAYMLRAFNGRVFWSAPSPEAQISLGTGPSVINVTTPLPRFQNRYEALYVAVFMSAAGGTTLTLQRAQLADRSANTVTIGVSSYDASSEILYTTGEVRDHIPPPTHRTAFAWRDRLFLCDTDTGEVWYSKRIAGPRDGLGFNEIFSFAVQDGSGPVLCGAPLDHNYAVLFKRDGAWLIGGEGPDLQGRGNYVPQRVAGSFGCTATGSLVTTGLGVFFQNRGDGGIYLVGHTGEIVFVGEGVWDQRAAVVVGAIHNAAKRHVYFLTDSSRIWVYDYGTAVPEEGRPGQWYTWRLPAEPIGGVLIDDRPHFLTATGQVWRQVAGQWFDGGGTPILPRLELAPASLAGLQGFARLSRGALLGQVHGACSLRVSVTPGFNGAAEVFPTKALAPGLLDFDFRPSAAKSTAWAFTIEEVASGNLTRGFALEGIAFEAAVKAGIRRAGARLG
jgi:hypothetical protein